MLNFDTDLLMQLFGVFFILAGLAGLTGIWKGWYWRSRNMTYGYLPFGVLFLLTSFEKQIRAAFPAATWVVLVLYTLVFGIGVWWFTRPPSWIKPRWIRLIEAEPPAVYQEMARQVRQGTDWRDRVTSPAAVEDWIRSVRKSWMKSKR